MLFRLQIHNLNSQEQSMDTRFKCKVREKKCIFACEIWRITSLIGDRGLRVNGVQVCRLILSERCYRHHIT